MPDGPRIDPGASPDECLLHVRAQPGARRRGPLGLWAGCLKVGLAAPPEDGRANRELLLVLAELLDLRAGDLELVRGARSRGKLVRIPLPAAEAARRLADRTAPPGRA